MQESDENTHVLDARGLVCPMPLLKLKQQMNRMSAGQVIRVETTDSGSLKDFEAFCKQAGHDMTVESDGQVHRFVIQKSAAGA